VRVEQKPFISFSETPKGLQRIIQIDEDGNLLYNQNLGARVVFEEGEKLNQSLFTTLKDLTDKVSPIEQRNYRIESARSCPTFYYLSFNRNGISETFRVVGHGIERHATYVLEDGGAFPSDLNELFVLLDEVIEKEYAKRKPIGTRGGNPQILFEQGGPNPI